MKIIVISAVNIVDGGPLTILKDCLFYLSQWVGTRPEQYRVIAIVYRKQQVAYPNIEYIEVQWPKKRWINRLWYEYVSLKRLSKSIGPVYLWFSLHDTTPHVIAKRRAVYCHNALSFYKRSLRDFVFAPKMTIMGIFTKYIYLPNIHKNNYVVVQQEWFRNAMSSMFGLGLNRIIVAPPAIVEKEDVQQVKNVGQDKLKTFIYAASSNNHKNFEVICKAAEILEQQDRIGNFQVYITIRGDENSYTKWLYKKWGKLASVRFVGFLSKKSLQDYYRTCDALIYPSKAESWGLPISEFSYYNKPMLLADLAYAHETASGAERVSFFDPDKPEALAILMKAVVKDEYHEFNTMPLMAICPPVATDWIQLFCLLLEEDGHRIGNK